MLEHSKVDLALAKAQRKVKLQLMLESKNKEWRMNSNYAPYQMTRDSDEHFRLLKIDTNYMLDKDEIALEKAQENYSFDPTNKTIKSYSFDGFFKSEFIVISCLSGAASSHFIF